MLNQREGALVERFRLIIFVLGFVYHRQVVQRRRQGGMLRTNGLFEEFQDMLVERFGLSVFSLSVVQHGQCVQRRGEAWGFGASVFHILERGQVKHFCIRLLAALVRFDTLGHIVFPTGALGASPRSPPHHTRCNYQSYGPQSIGTPALLISARGPATCHRNPLSIRPAIALSSHLASSPFVPWQRVLARSAQFCLMRLPVTHDYRASAIQPAPP